jgi:hypothetical protein
MPQLTARSNVLRIDTHRAGESASLNVARCPPGCARCGYPSGSAQGRMDSQTFQRIHAEHSGVCSRGRGFRPIL